MTTASRYWADWSTRDFAELGRSGHAASTIAVLPIAAVEQHGPHLPLQVDARIVEGIIAQAVPLLPASLRVLFLPVQAIGLSTEHACFPGTLRLRAETVLRLWTELGESVAACGIRKLLFFNGHGGNVGPMDVVARDLRLRCGLCVYRANWFDLPWLDATGEEVRSRCTSRELRYGVHAGEIETSLMLALAPEWVAMEWAQDFHSSAEERNERFPILGGCGAKRTWLAQDLHSSGAVGNAAAATAELGHTILQAAAHSLVRLLAEWDRLDAVDIAAQSAP
ncbi:creatininase family protein [Candidatus Symbiobacter mobilis]|uniref:Creatinine amidohydrolase n=1 Tax=Candidatus Symbiobacter mobilis CR TaxID=946483 RepID=U5N8J1_9BURK|nr:creatininase family protein [Candidatus Symbiobacter mobilis]AGX86499.1 creatinine amidohydrolase [Candidatus Symbiobacter mobilis CR]